MHARWGLARTTPSKFLVARVSEQEAQNIPPQSRQWWRRRTIVNFAPHLVQDAASLSGCHVAFALADATSSLRVGMAVVRSTTSRAIVTARAAHLAGVAGVYGRTTTQLDPRPRSPVSPQISTDEPSQAAPRLLAEAAHHTAPLPTPPLARRHGAWRCAKSAQPPLLCAELRARALRSMTS